MIDAIESRRAELAADLSDQQYDPYYTSDQAIQAGRTLQSCGPLLYDGNMMTKNRTKHYVTQ